MYINVKKDIKKLITIRQYNKFYKKIKKNVDFKKNLCYNNQCIYSKITIEMEFFMLSREITVVNVVGLHARPATFFIQKANTYKSSVWIGKGDRQVNAKSLLGVLSMGIVKGTPITLVADGEDEREAIAGLEDLILNGLDNCE